MNEPDVLVCPRCGTAAEQHEYCKTCGLHLAELAELSTQGEWSGGQAGGGVAGACPSCNTPTASGDRFCPNCGAQLASEEASNTQTVPQVTAAATAQAGWYPDPQAAAGQRYWDGRNWTDQIAPPVVGGAGQTTVPASSGGADTLTVLGYIFAVIIPFVGFILGVVRAAKHSGPGTNHGVWIIVVSVGAFLFWLAVLSSGSGGGY